MPRALAGAQPDYEGVKREREIRPNQFRRQSRFEPVVRDPLDSGAALFRGWGRTREDYWDREQGSHPRQAAVRF